MKVSVVGATGLVGSVMLRILEERGFPVSQMIPVASEASVGKEVVFNGKTLAIVSIEEAVNSIPDLALFSAGGNVSKEWAPQFAKNGTTVIDNSSFWRMDPSKKLIVPEINARVLTSDDKIIANPNCSTIQMVMALAPLQKEFGIKRVVVSTYQSVTGTGANALKQLENEQAGIPGNKVYHYPIHSNVIPHCDVFMESGDTKEEIKMVKETCKILGDDTIKVSATAVRVPVKGGHSESINVELRKPFELKKVKELLQSMTGITVIDDIDNSKYPMPLYAEGKDDIFVGRIREDDSQVNTLNMWVVADNLRKGAATNAIQIAEYLIANGILNNSVTTSLK
jgi:aspartate-semialdehyde dehydrogenase